MPCENTKETLRKQAEAILKNTPSYPGRVSGEDPAGLIQELRLHEIELELQNEELRKTHEELTASRDLFLQLFHQAPMGYLILDERGIVLEANETFCCMTGLETADIRGRGIADFLAEADRTPFLARYEALFESPKGKSMEADLLTAHGKPLAVRMEASLPWKNFPPSSQESVPCLPLTVTDITERRQAGKALQVALNELRQVFETITPLCVIDKEYRIAQVNESFCALVGFERQSLLGKPCHEVWPKRSTCEGSACMLNQVLAGSERCTCEIEMDSKDGKTISVMVIAQPFRDAAGEIVGIIETCVDITERKKVEEALRLSEARYRTTLMGIGDGVMTTDLHGRVELLNPVAERLTGWAAEEARGRPLEEVFPIVNEEKMQPVENPVREVLRKGTVVGLANHTLLIRRDGARIPIADSGAPIRNGRGDVTGVVLVFRDQTSERASEKALRQSENLFRRVFDILPIGLWIADAKGNLLRGNPAGARIWGEEPLVGPEEYGVFKARRLPSGEEIAPHDWALAHTVREGVTVTDEMLEIDAFDGQKKVILNYTAPVLDDDGSIEGAIVVNRDITERIRMEEEREAVVRLLKLLNTNNNLHELMQIVTGFLHDWFNVEAVGIRLRDGDDYPYFETRGFPPEFIRAENFLCAVDLDGQIQRDAMDHPILECMCGNVLSGRVDPSLPFFTPSGGFWTNSTTELLAGTTEAERQARTRNRCHGEGYESVALIPLRSGEETLGLLQLNDRRKDRFTERSLGLLERLAASLSMAIMQRRAEAALQTERDNLRTIMHASPVGLLVIDENFEVTDANGAAGLLFPQRPAPPGARRCGDFLGCVHRHEDPCGCGHGTHCADCALNKAIKEVLSGGAGGHSRDMLIPTDPEPSGKPTWVNFTVEGITLNGCRQALVSMVDITERIQAEKERERLQAQFFQAQKMESVGQLAGGVAHDLNNLLSPILGYGELLLADFSPEDDRRKKVDQIVSAGMRARDLVRQLLAFSRKQTLELKLLDINKVVTGFARLLRRTIREDISMNLSLAPSLPLVHGDVGQIEQVLMNLAVNAQDAMPQGGGLTLETSVIELDGEHAPLPPQLEPGPYVMLSVGDTGCGISPSVLEHIFEPFFTTKESGKGTGLGLATVYGIIKQHGGSIQVVSEESRGATFNIYLPVASASDIPLIEAEGTPMQKPGFETVLLVEDNEQVRDLTRLVLESQGYRVLPAGSGREALGILEEYVGPVHLLLTDVIMPDMNGKELFTTATARVPGLKVLFMSGYTADVIAHHGVLQEGVQFIQKPFTLQALATKVREVLSD